MQAAMADYNKAHELNPGAIEPLYLRGLLYALAEQWDDAATDLTQVDRARRRARRRVATIAVSPTRIRETTIARSPTTRRRSSSIRHDPNPLINRGMLYAKQKSYERAIADYDKAASVAPAMINPHYNKAQALEQMDRPKEAAAEYRIVLQKAGSADSDMVRLARQRLAAIEKSPED